MMTVLNLITWVARAIVFHKEMGFIVQGEGSVPLILASLYVEMDLQLGLKHVMIFQIMM